MVKYGLTGENQNLIIEKAKAKKDGVYEFRGVAYRVRGGKVTHFAADYKILAGFGAFNVVVGSYPFGAGQSKLALKKING